MYIAPHVMYPSFLSDFKRTDGRTGTHDEADSHFSYLGTAPKEVGRSSGDNCVSLTQNS